MRTLLWFLLVGLFLAGCGSDGGSSSSSQSPSGLFAMSDSDISAINQAGGGSSGLDGIWKNQTYFSTSDEVRLRFNGTHLTASLKCNVDGVTLYATTDHDITLGTDSAGKTTFTIADGALYLTATDGKRTCTANIDRLGSQMQYSVYNGSSLTLSADQFEATYSFTLARM